MYIEHEFKSNNNQQQLIYIWIQIENISGLTRHRKQELKLK